MGAKMGTQTLQNVAAKRQLNCNLARRGAVPPKKMAPHIGYATVFLEIHTTVLGVGEGGANNREGGK